VMAGFIVGFDADDQTIFERQRAFIARSPISMAMIGILTALPGTQLWRRLAAEGRLHGDAEGDAAYRPNFDTKMPEAVLVEGYGRLLGSLYEPKAYFARALHAFSLQRHLPPPRYRRSLRYSLRVLFQSLWRQGVRSAYRGVYWRFLLRAALIAPRRFARAFALAVHGEHMIRYTFQDVLPRVAGPLTRRSPVRAPVADAIVPLSRVVEAARTSGSA